MRSRPLPNIIRANRFASMCFRPDGKKPNSTQGLRGLVRAAGYVSFATVRYGVGQMAHARHTRVLRPLKSQRLSKVGRGHPWPEIAPSQCLALGPARPRCRPSARARARLLKLAGPHPTQAIPSSSAAQRRPSLAAADFLSDRTAPSVARADTKLLTEALVETVFDLPAGATRTQRLARQHRGRRRPRNRLLIHRIDELPMNP